MASVAIVLTGDVTKFLTVVQFRGGVTSEWRGYGTWNYESQTKQGGFY